MVPALFGGFDKIPTVILEPFENKGFVLLPISSGERKSKVGRKTELLNQKGTHLNTGLYEEKKITTAHALESIPKSYVIDPYGIIRHIIKTAYSKDCWELRQSVKHYLKNRNYTPFGLEQLKRRRNYLNGNKLFYSKLVAELFLIHLNS